MKKTIFLSGISIVALSACVPSEIALETIAPASSTDGYASSSSSYDNSGVTVTASGQLINNDWLNGVVNRREYQVSISPTGNTDEYLVVVDGYSVVVNWDSTDNVFYGINGDFEISISPWFYTTSGQTRLDWINQWDHSGQEGDSWGAFVTGFNTDPAQINALTGNATFYGNGGISINATDNSIYTTAGGAVEIGVNFGSGAIDGIMFLSDTGHGYGGITVPYTEATLDGNVTDNTFSGSVDIDLGDFGLSSVSMLEHNGMFYEVDGKAVGSQIIGNGVADASGKDVVITGAFVAEKF